MNQARPQPLEDRPPRADRPGPHVAAARLVDRWDDDRWRAPVLGVALAVLTLPAVAMVLVGLLVLAVQGVATWLVVVGTALVTTLLGALGAVVTSRRGHPGVVHRLGLLAWVWGVVVVVLAVVLALRLDEPERVAIAVLLVLGGTYTVVLGFALWGASRVMPAPVEPIGGPAAAAEGDEVGPHAPSGAPAGDDVPTPAAAPDDDELAEWPEWGAADPGRPDARGTDEGRGATDPGDGDELRARQPRATATPRPGAVEAEPGATAGRRTPAVPARRPAAPPAEGAGQPRRRSVTSSGPQSGHVTRPGDPAATERIARQDGDDGPPTQRIPPVEL